MGYRSCTFFALSVVCAFTFVNAQFSLRIVGGTVAKEAEFPFLVSLRHYENHFCGGTIIHERYILTAAHCFANRIMFPYIGITVVSGTTNLLEGGQSHRIIKAVHHPRFFNSLPVPHDLGLLKLRTPIVFNTYQQSIGLASTPIIENTIGFTAGWGTPYSGIPMASLNLKVVHAFIIGVDTCTKYMGYQLYSGQICSIQNWGHGVCLGDSGSPLVANGEVVGITSWGSSQCATGRPEVFTNVYLYRKFILEHLQD